MRLFALVLTMAVIASMPITAAQTGHSDFSDVQSLIDNPVDCSQLSESQLERLGEYFMELRHPGEAHEIMDDMMGGEGSESLKQAHIRMGEAFYCNSAGMVTSMMGGGMMGFDTDAGMMNGYGMMQGFGFSYVLAGTIIALLVIIILLLLRRK
jgi:hypothetical protein